MPTGITTTGNAPTISRTTLWQFLRTAEVRRDGRQGEGARQPKRASLAEGITEGITKRIGTKDAKKGWQPGRDSNPDTQLQRLQSYR